MSDVAMDTSSESTTKNVLKEMKEVVEEAENRRDAPANGNASEETGSWGLTRKEEEEKRRMRRRRRWWWW